MKIDNLGDIQAVAFDIDGTLYRAFSLNIRVFPYIIRNHKFFFSYNKTRKIMHHSDKAENFKNNQLKVLSENLKCSYEQAEEILHKTVHSGLAKFFAHIKPCKGAVELIADLKSAGLKIALLSDLPPEQKGEIWGIKKYCDVCLWSEDAGAIKPASLPFEKMAELLGIAPENILYVGNNHKYDILGAKNAGMKTAWIVSPLAAKLGKKSKDADITFGTYQELRKKMKV